VAKQEIIQLPCSQFKGLVLRPSAVNRDFNSAQLCSNVEKLKNGQTSVRKGVQCMLRAVVNPYDFKAFFPFTYTYYDTETGSTQEELLTFVMAIDVANNIKTPQLYRVKEEPITIAYSGTGTGTIDIVPVFDSTANRWTITVKSNGVTDYTDTISSAASSTAVGLLTVLNNIDALANFAVSPTFSSSISSPYLDSMPKSISIASGGSYTFTSYDLELIGDCYTAPKAYTDADFILPCSLDYVNNMYLAYGTYEHKYDGHAVYLSGLPQAVLTLAQQAGSGASHPLAAVYIYKLVYSRVDNRGNIIDGEDSDDTLSTATVTITVALRDVNLTIQNIQKSFTDLGISQATNVHGAKVNGAQVGVTTITVDAAHTMVVGDTAYFYDGVTSLFVEREVTAIAATTITIAGSNVNVADNIFISNNVRIQIWRTKNASTDFYFLQEIPNDYVNDTQVFVDSFLDTSLVEPFREQLRKHSFPPKCSFLDTHQGLKISSGDPDFPNRVRWALPQDVEGYPLESNLTDMQSGGNGAVTAIGSVGDEEYAVFKEDGFAVLKGTLDDLSFSIKDRANIGIGCMSFRSLAYVGENNALMGISKKGPFIFADGVPSLAIGYNIRPLFTQPHTAQVNGTPVPDSSWLSYLSTTINLDVERVLKRAVAINDNINSKYHVYLPAEVGTPAAQKYTLYTSSKYLVFDYEAEVPFWTEYSFYDRYRTIAVSSGKPNVTPAHGFAMYKDNLWFGQSSYRSSTENLGLLFKYNSANDNTDYTEAGYPVYLDIHYTPYTREMSAATALFKALFVNVYKFLSDLLADRNTDEGLGDNFSIKVRLVRDYKNYPTPVYATEAGKTFDVSNGRTSLPFKCVTDKCRAAQIQITNDNADITAYERPIIDNVEFIYCVPYDKQKKEPKT
jgi:hypothetical protein